MGRVIEGDDHPDAGEIVPVFCFGVAADGAGGRIGSAAFELVAAVGHLNGLGTPRGQQDVRVHVSAADVVEVIGEEFAQADLIGQDDLSEMRNLMPPPKGMASWVRS